jgi:hypothetical protein
MSQKVVLLTPKVGLPNHRLVTGPDEPSSSGTPQFHKPICEPGIPVVPSPRQTPRVSDALRGPN